jgi:hypothetical protein
MESLGFVKDSLQITGARETLIVRHVLLPIACRTPSSKGAKLVLVLSHPKRRRKAFGTVTCCATNSCLSRHAQLVTAGYEALETTCLCDVKVA